MISTINDLRKVLTQDALANKKSSLVPSIYGDTIWKFILLLRFNEYFSHLSGNRRRVALPIIYFCKYLFYRLSIKLNYTIPLNTFGEGLSIAHPGTIVVNSHSVIGKNCRLQTGVTIGATNGSDKAPIIGNNVFLGDGCKIIGDIIIADDVAIGANAVVTKSILERATTWGGIPAKKISDNDSHSNLSPLLFK